MQQRDGVEGVVSSSSSSLRRRMLHDVLRAAREEVEEGGEPGEVRVPPRLPPDLRALSADAVSGHTGPRLLPAVSPLSSPPPASAAAASGGHRTSMDDMRLNPESTRKREALVRMRYDMMMQIQAAKREAQLAVDSERRISSRSLHAVDARRLAEVPVSAVDVAALGRVGPLSPTTRPE